MVFNVIFRKVIFGDSTTAIEMACIFVVIFGYIVGSKGEVNFSPFGMVCGATASLFVAIHSVFTKQNADVVQSKWLLSLYKNINASFMFLPFVFYFEVRKVLATDSNISYARPVKLNTNASFAIQHRDMY